MLINLKNISKSYIHKGDNIQVLKNINLGIEKGEKIAIMGNNGSGKTTLLNLIGTIDTPDKGEYIFNDKKLSIDQPLKLNKLRRNHFGYIPQGFCLIRDKKGFYNISLPLLFRGYTKEVIEEKVDEISSTLKIKHLLNKKPDNMSAGERQKISIARAMITNPEVILADEMTNTLDKESKNIVLGLIKDSRELTAIVVTHDILIAKKCDRILYLDDGIIQSS
ncbi:ABC transporter related [Alkaliphilus metalliredigens QYMF]|uniref:ABC transporter related n=1 Tax=Alkaliphilus metalliredigens (strain QYMF) TaxID=293826 RepID=A6TVN5_ALKMQ|nr:ABC transporter ATP-binding protein [Alkaliphilus metalliredigens]ABR50253.1 ABC transporter related [Alkaliphilus metalliredigens QYMF]